MTLRPPKLFLLFVIVNGCWQVEKVWWYVSVCAQQPILYGCELNNSALAVANYFFVIIQARYMTCMVIGWSWYLRSSETPTRTPNSMRGHCRVFASIIDSFRITQSEIFSNSTMGLFPFSLLDSLPLSIRGPTTHERQLKIRRIDVVGFAVDGSRKYHTWQSVYHVTNETSYCVIAIYLSFTNSAVFCQAFQPFNWRGAG